MWCRFGSISSLILCLKLPTEARSVSWGTLAHSLRRDVFEAKTLVWVIEDTFAFNKDFTEKFIGFISGDPQDRNFTPKSWKMTFAPVLSFYCGVEWCSTLLEGKRLILEIFFLLFKSWILNIINVEIRANLNPLFHDNQRWLPRFEDLSPHYEWKRILSFGRLFPRTHQWLLNIFRPICH